MLSKSTIGAVVPVTDLDRSIEFYGQTLGLGDAGTRRVPQSPGARFQIGGGELYVYESVGAGQSPSHALRLRGRRHRARGRRPPRPRRDDRGVRHAGDEDRERDHRHGRRHQGRLLQGSRRQHPRARAARPRRGSRLAQQPGGAVPARIAGGAARRDDADAAEVVVRRGPAAHLPAEQLELLQAVLVDARLRVDDRPAAWKRGRSTAACGTRPSSRIPAQRRRARCAIRVPPAAPPASTRLPSPSKREQRRRHALHALTGDERRRGAGRPRRACCSGGGRSPGSQSPEPSPSVVVSTQTLPSHVGGDEVRGVAGAVQAAGERRCQLDDALRGPSPASRARRASTAGDLREAAAREHAAAEVVAPRPGSPQ